MQRVTASHQSQTARVSVDQGQTTPPQYAARRCLVLKPDSVRQHWTKFTRCPSNKKLEAVVLLTLARTRALATTLLEYSYCVPFRACFNLKNSITSDDRPSPPEILSLEVNIQKRMANVSWAVSPNAAHFLVNFYVSTDVTCTTTTVSLQLTFGNIPVCKQLRVGVSAENEAGLSNESLSPEFYIPG
ncbi:hypothetical protein T265_14523, partial [Opisthorchis viverrini]